MTILFYLICSLIGYLFGSSNMAFFISKLKKVDLRSGGSGNLGTSNALIMMGKSAGVLVLLHDVLKTIIAIFICRYLFPGLEYVGVVAGVASVLGHIFPFYLRFKGGKGFASYIGLVLGINWRLGLIILVIIVIVSAIFDWIVAGTMSTIVIAPAYYLFHLNYIVCLILLIASSCILWKHRENFVKKKLGQEFSVRQALFKK